jgi:hypothetical protein
MPNNALWFNSLNQSPPEIPEGMPSWWDPRTNFWGESNNYWNSLIQPLIQERATGSYLAPWRKQAGWQNRNMLSQQLGATDRQAAQMGLTNSGFRRSMGNNAWRNYGANVTASEAEISKAELDYRNALQQMINQLSMAQRAEYMTKMGWNQQSGASFMDYLGAIADVAGSVALLAL